MGKSASGSFRGGPQARVARSFGRSQRCANNLLPSKTAAPGLGRRAAPNRPAPRRTALLCVALHFRLQEEEEEEKEEENLGRVIKTVFLFLSVYKEFNLKKNILYKSFKETHKETQDDLRHNNPHKEIL